MGKTAFKITKFSMRPMQLGMLKCCQNQRWCASIKWKGYECHYMAQTTKEVGGNVGNTTACFVRCLTCVQGHCASLLSKTILFWIGSNNMGGGLQSNSTFWAVATCDRLRQLDKFLALASYCYCDQKGRHPGNAAKQSTTRMLEVYCHAGPPISTSDRSF